MVHECPHCGVRAYNKVQIGFLFGWRTLRGETHPQSRCHACRNCKKARCRCRPAALGRHAKRLEGRSLRQLAGKLRLTRTDKGRLGKATEVALGLKLGDNSPAPDWHGKVEVKLIAMRRATDGSFRVKDKVFVCADSRKLNPVAKIRRMQLVFYDHDSSEVLLTKRVHLSRAKLDNLARCRRRRRKTTRHGDALFLNTKGSGNTAAKKYAWYLSRTFVQQYF